MDNYEAIAYATIALKQLQEEDLIINHDKLKGRMLSLMDRYSEKEIWKIYSEIEW